ACGSRQYSQQLPARCQTHCSSASSMEFSSINRLFQGSAGLGVHQVKQGGGTVVTAGFSLFLWSQGSSPSLFRQGPHPASIAFLEIDLENRSCSAGRKVVPLRANEPLEDGELTYQVTGSRRHCGGLRAADTHHQHYRLNKNAGVLARAQARSCAP